MQTCKPKHRKYRGPGHALWTILREEYPNDWSGLYFNPHLFIPSLLYHGLDPLFKFAIPVLLDRGLGITQDEEPVLYILGEYLFNLLELLVMMPIETIRLRLQCQIKAHAEERPFDTLVALSPIAYSGMWDCAYRILREEGEQHKRLQGLYRGFKVRFISHTLVALIQLLNSE